MKVGVTGGAGFIGGWVCAELIRRGHSVVVFDPRGRPVEGAETWMGTVTDASAVYDLAMHVDGIVHLAGMLGTQETMQHPVPAFTVNALGGLHVLEACRYAKVALVNIAVGNWWMRNTYSTSKHTVERFVEQYRDEFGVRAVNVRAVNAYGPGQTAAPPFAANKVRKIMPALICRALSGMPVELYGDGSQVSDCVYVADVAEVLAAALESVAGGQVPQIPLEVGPIDDNATVADIAGLVVATVAEVTGRPPVDVKLLPMRPGEQPGVVTAYVSTLTMVGIDPAGFVPLAEGIRRTVEWFRTSEGVTWRSPE